DLLCALRRRRARGALGRPPRAATAERRLASLAERCARRGGRDARPARDDRARRPDGAPRPRGGVRLAPPRVELALDRRPARARRRVAEPAGREARRRPHRDGAALLERRVRLRARALLERRRRKRPAPARALGAVADEL